MSSGEPLFHQSRGVGNGDGISGCKDARGPYIRFEGISLELSSFSGCQFDFARDGTLVLTFDGYRGTVTLKNANRHRQQQQMPLCSAVGSEAGSLGVLEEGESVFDQTDYDMALSQLEQGDDSPQQQKHQKQATDDVISPGSPSRSGFVLFSSPSAVRQACEGRAEGDSDDRGEDESRHVLISGSGKPSPPSGPPSCHPHGTENRRTLANLVSPPSSLKNAFRNVNNAHAESCSSLRDDASHTSKADAQTGTSPTIKQASLKSTAKAPKAPKNKRPARDRSGDGGENASPDAPPSAAGSASTRSSRGKRARRGRDEPKPLSVSTPPKKTAEKENRARERVSCAAEEGGGTTDESCEAKNANGVPQQQRCRLGEAKDESVKVSMSPASSAAAAWVASTSPTSPGPLCRSAKAQVLGNGGVPTKEGVLMTLPMGRWGHSATMISETQMLVLGGQADDDAHQATLGDLHKFDFATRSWSRPMNCDSIPRAWHTASFIAGKNLLVIFGGERTVDGCPECLDDIMVLDTDIDLLYPPAISGKSPTARSGHSAAIIGTDLVVFGGVRGRKWQNSVAVLDTERWHWRHPTIDGSNPAPRSYHSATVVGKLMVVFGGNNQNESFDKVHVLETGKSRWEWFCPEVVGAAPASRTGHSAVLLPDGYTILIHGGWDPEDEGGVKNFGDAYLLDTHLWEWSRGPETLLGTKDAGLRVGHTALLARGSNNNSNDEGKKQGGTNSGCDEESYGWIAAFFGGQDGEGVRRSELALVSL